MLTYVYLMSDIYVLIDFENVQPEGLALLNSRSSYHVCVFVGATQKSVSVDKIVLPLQELGNRGKIVQVKETGPNALDFHIAFCLGQLAEREKDACFRIVSKDKGFDPLVAHMKAQERDVARHESVHAMLGVSETIPEAKKKDSAAQAVKTIPRPSTVTLKPTRATQLSRTVAQKAPAPLVPTAKQAAKPATVAQLGCIYLKMLKNPKSTRPGTLTKLRNDILSKNTGTSAQSADAVVTLLKNRRLIVIDAEGTVTYHLDGAVPKADSCKKSPQEICWLLVEKLDMTKHPKATRPGSQTALAGFIRATFPKQKLTDNDLSDIIRAMTDKDFITVDGNGKIAWPTTS